MPIYNVDASQDYNHLFQEALDTTIRDGGEVGVQLAIHLDGKLVVDVCAGIADVETGQPVQSDTLFPTFSVIKAVTATALHLQAERHLVKYDAPVARYWPEFASNGKDQVTIQNVLHHRSGVWQMPTGVTPELMSDYDWMVRQIQNLSPMFKPGTRNGYMGLTFGWIIAEIVRRTDPEHRPFGRFIQEEIVHPLAIEDIWIGISPDMHSRVARLIDAPARQIPADAPALRAIPPQVGTREEIFGRRDIREACIPAANGLATARSLARFFAMLANSGELDGVRLLSKDRVRLFSEPRRGADQPDDVLGYPIRIGAGFWTGGNTQPVNYGRLIGDNLNAIGHPGSGGSIAWADPDARLAVSICHNRLFTPPNFAFDAIRRTIAEAFGA